MAGATVEIQGSTQVLAAFNQLLQLSEDLRQPLAEIGEYLDESTKARFVTQESPDGDDWQPLSALTLSRKNRKDRILTEVGTLADNLHYQLTGESLIYGSNEVYAAMMQFGGKTSPDSMFPNKEIPARPFLGINDADQDEILAILRGHISASVGV